MKTKHGRLVVLTIEQHISLERYRAANLSLITKHVFIATLAYNVRHW